jgi:hypothetical protein
LIHHEQPTRKSQGKSFKENDGSLTASSIDHKKHPRPITWPRVKNEKMKNKTETNQITVCQRLWQLLLRL